MNCSYEKPEGHNFLLSFQLTSYKPPHIRGALDVSNKMQYQDDPVEIIDTRDILSPDSNVRSRLGIKSVAAIILQDHEGLKLGDSIEPGLILSEKVRKSRGGHLFGRVSGRPRGKNGHPPRGPPWGSGVQGEGWRAS